MIKADTRGAKRGKAHRKFSSETAKAGVRSTLRLTGSRHPRCLNGITVCLRATYWFTGVWYYQRGHTTSNSGTTPTGSFSGAPVITTEVTQMSSLSHRINTGLGSAL